MNNLSFQSKAIPSQFEEVALPNRFDIERSQIATNRMLRMLLGQLMQARVAADEVINDSLLSDTQKDLLCNTVGAALKGWISLAQTSLLPSYSDQNDKDIQEKTCDPKSHPMYCLLDDTLHQLYHCEFSGVKWFTGEESSKMFGSWQTFSQNGYQKILELVSPQQQDVFVAEYQLNKLTPLLRDSLASIFSKWCINTSSKQDQLGLEWMVTPDEIEGYLKKDSAILYVLFDRGLPRAIQIDFTDIGLTQDPEQKLPSVGGSAKSLAWCKKNNIDPSKSKYTFIVAIDRDWQGDMKARGLDPYHMLLDASDESAHWLSIQHAFGGVRIQNENFGANLAMGPHKKRGWQETDEEFNTVRGSTLRLVHRDVPPPVPKEVLSEYDVFIWSGSRLNTVLGDPAKLGAEDRQNVSAIRSMHEAVERAKAFLEEHKWHEHCQVYPRRHSTDKQDIVCIQKGNVSTYFYQAVKGEDKWQELFHGEVLPFEQYLEWYLDLIKQLPH
jgi:hypothetical protein